MSRHDPIDALISRWSERLLVDGYCIIPDLLPRATIEALDADLARHFEITPFCQGGFYGARTKRFGRVLTRSPHTASLVQHELVVGIAERILSPWCDVIQLNLTQASAVHPGSLPQVPHRDQDMWRGATGEFEYLINVIWPLTPFTRDNGATLVWPESHGRLIAQPVAEASEIAAEMEPGSALLFLGSTLHAAGGNRSSAVRRGMIAGYSLGWLKTYENQFLAYPPAVARHFPPELASLIGYRQHRPISAIMRAAVPPSCSRAIPGRWARSTRCARTRRQWSPSSSRSRSARKVNHASGRRPPRPAKEIGDEPRRNVRKGLSCAEEPSRSRQLRTRGASRTRGSLRGHELQCHAGARRPSPPCWRAAGPGAARRWISRTGAQRSGAARPLWLERSAAPASAAHEAAQHGANLAAETGPRTSFRGDGRPVPGDRGKLGQR
jgi:hypothetical protein